MLAELYNTENNGNVCICSPVVLCADTGGTTLVFTGRNEKAFETASYKGRCCRNVSHFNPWLLNFWHSKHFSGSTDELKLSDRYIDISPATLGNHFARTSRERLAP
jgi:hypothetical protein